MDFSPKANQMPQRAIEKQRLRDNVIARISLAIASIGVLLLLIGLRSPETVGPVRGIELTCIAYLLFLTAMYRNGAPVRTRGGIVTKIASPWTYKFCFIPLSLVGTGPLFILLGKGALEAPHVISTWTYLDGLVAIAAGLLFLLGWAILWGTLIVGTIVGICRFLRKVLSAQ
ncbi:hypothetical protein GM658_02090 [Pseudoduganella eburnea]|uniref:Uncharacterized protein n=1 Tax=Massilia eburnea TaxID=1776165 RepID=A0A6L6QA85_9BURK|nr:hypothetical protein [Massilia eburnea]MTW09378.1 hypothetical protein [Massilia eburnea]